MKLKSNEGITLVALVVTIIVLLILAGVSISMVFDSEGLFEKANSAAHKYNVSKNEEVDYLTNAMNTMDTYYNKHAETEEDGVIIINGKEYSVAELVLRDSSTGEGGFDFASWFERKTGGSAFSFGIAQGPAFSIEGRRVTFVLNRPYEMQTGYGVIILESVEAFNGLEITLTFDDDGSLVPID